LPASALIKVDHGKSNQIKPNQGKSSQDIFYCASTKNTTPRNFFEISHFRPPLQPSALLGELQIGSQIIDAGEAALLFLSMVAMKRRAKLASKSRPPVPVEVQEPNGDLRFVLAKLFG
jgi:hypothetical protein